MNEASPFSDPSLDPARAPKALPGSINVLTILTFIGCALGLFFSVIGYVRAEASYEQTAALLNSGDLDKAPAFLKSMMNETALTNLKKAADNKMPLLIINLVGTVLCFFGALQMRKLLKQGFYIWLMGEIIPFIGTVAFVGASYFTGVVPWVIVAIAAIFVILYAIQLKYMK